MPQYPEASIRDSIYIYCQAGELIASLPEVQGELNFEWSVYNPEIPGYGDPVSTTKGLSSSLKDPISGGYQVRISDGSALDTLFRAWVFINRPSVQVQVARHDCQVIDLSGFIETDTFHYYNPVDNIKYSMPAEYKFFWSADPFIPVSSSNTDTRIWDPPPVETRYTLRVVYYSCEASNTVTVSPVTTKADFSVSVREGEAPLEVSFDAGGSLNASAYEWYFDSEPNGNVAGVPDDKTVDPSYIYYVPGEYYVTLRTIAGLCDNYFTDPVPIKVLPSELEVPNVFTPDDDGYNDIFMVRAVSMREFHGSVFNRNGKKVFEWTDPAVGWDGKSDGSVLAPGVYYYIITGTGWDDRQYEFEGPLYLYRGR